MPRTLRRNVETGLALAPTEPLDWAKAFGGDSLARRYTDAIRTFLGTIETTGAEYVGRLSPRTREAYGAALNEFFRWLLVSKGKVVAPHDVTRRDADEYVAWCQTKPFGIRALELQEPERRAVFEAVRAGASDVTTISRGLPASIRSRHERDGAMDFGWLGSELTWLVVHDFLTRSPTLAELRKTTPQLGIQSFQVEREGQVVPLDSIFRYAVAPEKPLGRTSIAARVSALSSFWNVLARGENTGGGDAILRYNVWDEVKARVTKGLASERREAAQRANQLTPTIVRKLLDASEGTSLVEKRDSAMLWFLVLTAARVSESLNLRRSEPSTSDQKRYPGWLDDKSDPPAVVVFRKGGKRQRLPYPPYALRALHAFHEALGRVAKGETPAAERFRLLTKDDAPLFPRVHVWGANASSLSAKSYRNPMSRHAVTAMLGRLSERAGLSAADRKKVHAHAIRHFSATAMDAQGKPLREIQAILGHTSVTTTEGYLLDKESPTALSGQAEILGYLAQAPAPPASPPPPIIEKEQAQLAANRRRPAVGLRGLR